MQRPLVILLFALVTPVAIVAQADSARAPDPIAQLVGGPVEERLHDVGHTTHAHHADEQELEALRQAVTVLDGTETHRCYSRVPPLPKGEGGRG